jgi:hypothetical protein
MSHSAIRDDGPYHDTLDCGYSDLRRSPRTSCHVPITLRASDGGYIEAICLDVNYNGVGIKTEGALTVGQRLQLLARTNDGGTTAVPMLVIFSMEKHYGLSALEASEEILEQITMQELP